MLIRGGGVIEYDVSIGYGAISELIGVLKNVLELPAHANILLLTDNKVFSLYGEAMANTLRSEYPNVFTMELAVGENAKTMGTATRILSFLEENSFCSEDIIIALGGGVITDISGFVAAQYHRGIRFVSVPTTLLAMCDAALGGKTGVNGNIGKNAFGVFYQPRYVLCDLLTLDSLADRETLSGMAELSKYALTLSNVMRVLMTERDAPLTQILAEAVRCKHAVVNRDYRDTGERAILNFGHTVGHALEKLSGYSLPHGVCVARGMFAAIGISEHMSICTPECAVQARRFLESRGFENTPIADKEAIMRVIAADKKRHGERTKLILLRDIGRPVICDISLEELAAQLAAL